MGEVACELREQAGEGPYPARTRAIMEFFSLRMWNRGRIPESREEKPRAESDLNARET